MHYNFLKQYLQLFAKKLVKVCLIFKRKTFSFSILEKKKDLGFVQNGNITSTRWAITKTDLIYVILE